MKKRIFDSAAADRSRPHLQSYQSDCGALYAVGNGETICYLRGPEILQCFGSPYSCPSVFSLVAPEHTALKCVSTRTPNSNTIVHTLDQGVMLDAASAEHHCILRKCAFSSAVSFELYVPAGVRQSDVSPLFSGCAAAFLFTVIPGTTFYFEYPMIRSSFLLLVIDGTCTVNNQILTMDGECTLRICSSDDYAAVFDHMHKARAVHADDIISDAEAADAAFLSECKKHRKELRPHPLSAQLSESTEDTLLLIRSQQDASGGILAGHNYHMGYVRDQYGTFRGLLACGAVESARRILSYYRHVFDVSGCIHNAQALGMDGIFHIHENDASEITGYLLIQATDYLSATGDRDFFAALIPLLDWALRQQLDLLHHGMLPFNGDETYIAGGILPRTVIDHGSMESTMLFLTGGTRYLRTRADIIGSDDLANTACEQLASARLLFGKNFRRGNIYITNSSLRTNGLIEPDTRHGVCLNCGKITWLHRLSSGIFVCPDCFMKAPSFPAPEEYQLKSTLLMSPFIRADVIPDPLLKNTVSEFLELFEQTGALPSLPDNSCSLGYDYGLLLFAAARYHLNADKLLQKMLELQDECGGWAEYYHGNDPANTRCRPWESAINIAGGIEYLKKPDDQN